MPATRTQVKRAPTRATSIRRSRSSQVPPPNANAAAPTSSEIIVISSDDESGPSSRFKHTVSNRARSKQKGKLSTRSGVLEISSGDDELENQKASHSSRSTMTALQRQLREAKEEIERLRAEQKNISDVKTVDGTGDQLGGNQYEQLLSALDEQLNCEICNLRLWTPYALECGHTFCQKCLTDWFNTTLVKYMTDHPHWEPRAVLRQRIPSLTNLNLPEATRKELETQAQALLARLTQPKYTCPTCRAAVRNKPVEIYALKELSSIVAERLHESRPRRSPGRRHGDTRSHSGIWDGFFPFGLT